MPLLGGSVNDPYEPPSRPRPKAKRKPKAAPRPTRTQQAQTKVKAAQRSTNEAAAQAALQDAYEIARRQQIERQQALARAELEARARRQRAQTKQLISRVGQKVGKPVFNGETVRRAAEKRAAERRHEAYENLKTNASTVFQRLNNPWVREESETVAANQEKRALQLQRAGQRLVFRGGGFMQRTDSEHGEVLQQATDTRRTKALEKAEKTGNWNDVIKILDSQSRETGGRYVDQQLYDAVNDGYVKDVVKTGNDFEKALRQAERLFDAENAEGLQKLIESSKFKELEDKFREYFGDGRKPGKFARHAQVLTEIAMRRERLWVGTLLDPMGTKGAYETQRLVDEAYDEAEGMTFREKVLDPSTGEYKTVKRKGIDAYLAKEAARQQDIARQQFRTATQRLVGIEKMSREQGRRIDASYQDGRLVLTDLDLKDTLNETFRNLAGGKERFDEIVAATNPAEREQLIRDFMRDAAGAWKAPDLGDIKPIGIGRYSNMPQTVALTKARNQYMSRLKQALTGDSSGYGLGDALDQTIGIGDAIRAGSLPLASMMAWLREQRVRGFGDYNTPSVNLALWGEDFGLNVGTNVDPNGRQAYLDYQEALQSDDPNVRANATRAYGSGVIKGNVGWIIEGLADPLNLAAPVAWLNRARLAVTASGGLRGLRGIGGLSDAIAMYAKYSWPEFLGGFGRSKLRTDLAKLALAREAGVPGIDVLRMADDEIRELSEKALRGTDELVKSDVFTRLLERSDIDKDQLLNIVQAKLPKIAEEFDLSPVNPFHMQQRIRAAREGFARATKQAEEAVQLERRRIAQAEARDALERVRVQAGAKIAQRAQVSGADLVEHDRRLAGYIGVTKDYSEAAGRAARAADEIEAMGASGTVNRGRLLGLNNQLQRALRDMQGFEDQYRVWDGERRLVKEGMVARRYRELAEFRRSIGGDPTAPSYVDLSWQQVRQDRRLIQSRIRGLQAALAKAKDQAEIARLRNELTEAHKARVGVEFEAALLDRGRTVARTYGRRHIDRVKQAVREQRLGQKATSEQERAVETGRDLSNRLGSIEKVEHAPNLTAAQEKVLSDSGEALKSVSGADLVSYIRNLQTTKAGVRFGGSTADEVVERLEDLAAALGVPLADLDLQELMVALYRVSRSEATRDSWAGVWKFVSSRAGATLRSAGWKGKVAEFIDELQWDHVRRGAAWGLERHEELDKIVADSLAALRGRRAEGVVRGGRKRYGQPQLRELLRPDSDPAEVLTKMRVLRDEGVDVFEYDAARGALGDIMVRRNVQRGILRDAEALAKTEGISVDEAFLRVRSERAATESLREFEEFASRVENQGRSPEQILRLFEERYVGQDLGSVPGLRVTSFQEQAMRMAWREEAGFDFADEMARAKFLQSTGTVPPLGDRSKMRDWLVENGYWSPRTGDQIASGERVWSINEEREFFQRNWGYTPPWTDPEALAPLLNDQAALKAAFGEWGFFDDGFEEAIGGLDLTPEQTLDAVVWGREGLAGKRTLQEMRQWAVQRYGELVADVAEDGNFTMRRMPWLMEAETEYMHWLGKAMGDAGTQARRAEWDAATRHLPESVSKAVDQGYGMEINRALVQPDQVDKLGEAITSATRRRLERLREAGDIDPGAWLPQEQLRFAYDVANELLADPKWRGLLRGSTVPGALLNIWSQFWRMIVSFQPAFPIMNLIETFGPRRLMLAIFENGFRPLSRSGSGRRLVGSLREIGAESASLFHLAEGSQPFFRVRDKMLPINIRGGAAIRTVVEAPLTVSAWGEDRLRLDFARSVAGRTYDAALKSGLDEAAAVALARAEAKRVVGQFFVTGNSPSWLRALNQLVPFFSYNYELKRLAVTMVAQHPAMVLWGDRISRAIKDANRIAWEEEYPGVPFPEDDANSSHLWLKIGDNFYTVDLSTFSDWTRALRDVSGSQNVVDWFIEFVRVPHPQQLGMLAFLTGGTTPWGKPGSLRELSFYADLFFWMNGVDYENPKWKRDWIQITSQMLFFKQFGVITPLTAKRQQYFWFRQMDEDQARAYLEENPDLQAYFDQIAGSGRHAPGAEKSVHWYSMLSDDERAEYDSAFAEWKELNRTLDDQIFEYANQPWSEEYKIAKREAFIARTAFLKANPILVDSWGSFMDAAEFAELRDDWKLDELQDAWFNWSRPNREDFKTDLAYQQALVEHYEEQEEFLLANPALAERLQEGRTAIESAWKEQELHWSDVLEFQAKLKLRILEEQEKPEDDQDRRFIDLLYRWRDAASLELDAEAYEQVYGVLLPGEADRTAVARIRQAGGNLLKRVSEIPGFSDYLYGKATPEERADIRRNEWYANSIADVVQSSTSGKDFYEQLFKNPALLQEYWRRNPDAKARYQAGQEYFNQISTWVGYLKRNDFQGAQAYWDQMPGWVRDRYLQAHPDSGMADGQMGGSGSTQAVQYNGQFFSSPETRAAFIRGQEYFASIGRWVELLKAKDYVAADRWFRLMPEWMREKYYANHPDQRARFELDSRALREGAEYFLARGDDKLEILRKYPELRRFLAEHGGDEGAMRGLITEMYRAIPSSEAWVKRTFRERFPEVFSQASIGERRLKDVVEELVRNPEMMPFYKKALKLQTSLYLKQLQLSKTPPKPLQMERLRRAKKRSKRRAARFHSNWSLHRDMRRHRGE